MKDSIKNSETIQNKKEDLKIEESDVKIVEEKDQSNDLLGKDYS